MSQWVQLEHHFSPRMMVLTISARDFMHTPLKAAVVSKNPDMIEAAVTAIILAGEPSLEGGFVVGMHYDVYSNQIKVSYAHGSFPPVPFGQNLKEMPMLLPHVERVYQHGPTGPEYSTHILKSVDHDVMTEWHHKVERIMDDRINEVCRRIGVPKRVLTGSDDVYAGFSWEKEVKPLLEHEHMCDPGEAMLDVGGLSEHRDRTLKPYVNDRGSRRVAEIVERMTLGECSPQEPEPGKPKVVVMNPDE